jgi:4-carboxymuconolactone decarboxylase
MTTTPTGAETRFERGSRALAAIDGEAGEKVINALADIARA